jgi:NAD+ synthetase
MAATVGVRYDEIPIEPVFAPFLEALEGEFRNLPPDAAEENIQARIRGTLLMALSNKFGSIVLTTGNKSEMAVGYATLYGDMAGGFAVLKDISKTLVYRLCHYRNALGRVIRSGSSPARRRPNCARTRSIRIRCRPMMRSTASSKLMSSRTRARPRSSR